MSQMLGSALSLTALGRKDGFTIVPLGTPLTRLHYYDGKFLRAADLNLEQRYLQALVHLSNQAGGAGIVHGLSATLGSGDTLEVGAGLAIDPQGRVLLLPSASSIAIADLLGGSRASGGETPDGADTKSTPAAGPEVRAVGARSRARDIIGVERANIAGARGAAGGDRLPTLDMRAAAAMHLDRSAAWTMAAASGAGDFADCEAKSADTPDGAVAAADLYLIVVSHAESLCGHEDVYGRLCEAACTTRSERPYYVEGIGVAALPLALDVALGQVGPIVLSVRHLRSRVASAFYAREAAQIAALINKDGLNGSASETWCLGAEAAGGTGVPIGVLARAGTTTTFFDAWIARRERMDAPPRRYWAWRMAMRPWDVFLAQVLQFQCHLHELFVEVPGPGATDPCRDGRDLIGEASGALATFKEYYEKVSGALARLRLPSDDDVFKIDTVRDRLGIYENLLGRLDVAKRGITLGDRVLIRGGILEVPSAGYLPVARTSTVSVNEQVRRLLGDGVDLRFCVVRPDFVAHALEEAQHMERISLVDGLANAQARPRVDVLVPNGELIDSVAATNGMMFAGSLNFITAFSVGEASNSIAVTGAGRGELLPSGGVAFHFAGVGEAPSQGEFGLFVAGFDNLNEVRDRGNFGGITPSEATVPEGVFRLRDAARRLAPIRAAAFEGGVVRGRPEGIPSAVVDQPTTRRVTALWSTLRADEDPFALQVGQQTPMSGRLIVAIPTSRVSLVDVTMNGSMRIVDVTPGFGVTDRCRGFLSLDVVWSGHLGTTHKQQHDRLEATIELTRLDRAEGRAVAAVLTFAWAQSGAEVRLEFTTDWFGSPVAAKSEGKLSFGRQAQRVFGASMKENADVINPGNTNHDLAETALEVIDVILAEPAFKAHAEQLLFPPVSADQQEQVLRATLDWVLFHRRRDKDCGTRQPQIPQLDNRRYKVYAGLVRDPEQAKALGEALRANRQAELRRAQFVPVGIVEFGASSPNLLTAATAVAEQWQSVGHGNRIGLAAIANEGEAQQDGQPLSLSRLKQLELALAPVGMRVDATATSELLPQIPAPTLPADDTDGVIVIVTFNFVDVRRARVVLYEPEGASAFRRITSGPPALTAVAAIRTPLPDMTMLFHDNVLVEDNDAVEVFETLHRLTGNSRVPISAKRLELAMPDAPDEKAQKRADSVAAFLRNRQVPSAATGQPYFLLDPQAPVGTRKVLESAPDERDILREAGREVQEVIALIFEN